MAYLTLELQIGDVVQVLTVMESRLDDATDLMKDILLLEIRATQQRFEAQGPGWADLAPSTERQRFARAARGKGARNLGSLAILGSLQILRNTGLLLQSVGGGQSGAFDTGDGRGQSDKFTATITTNNPGAWNQWPNTRTGAPAREIFVWTDQMTEDATGMATDFLLLAGPYAI